MLEQIQDAKKFFLSRCNPFPQTVIVMGSGMSSVLSEVKSEVEIPFGEIPHVPKVSVQGHAGRIRIGTIGKTRVAICQGRLHYYEGLSMHTVVLPFRAMAMAGAEHFILTNAAGGIRPDLNPPSFMLIKDHINLMGTNSLIGPNINDFGPRFPDLSNLYDPKTNEVFKSVAKKHGIALHEGVYVATHGPSYETPAEIRMMRTMGGDVVGMSTVPEAIALRHMGKKVSGLSCVTNFAAGVSDEVLTHESVLQYAKTAHATLDKLLRETVLALEHA